MITIMLLTLVSFLVGAWCGISIYKKMLPLIEAGNKAKEISKR